MGYIYARQIKKGYITLADVPSKYKEATINAYYALYGIILEG